MATPSTVGKLVTTRDRDVLLAALDYGPMTAAQLLAFSQIHPHPFHGVRKIYDRLRVLARIGFVQKFPYNLDALRGANYYTLSLKGFRYLHGPGAKPTTKWHLARISHSRKPHTFALMEFLVHTIVCAHRAGLTLTGFARENSVKLSAFGMNRYFDAAAQLVCPGVLDYRFIVEIDNHTRTHVATHGDDYLLSTLRFYEHLADSLPGRFRVLWVTTGDSTRLDHILAHARSAQCNPQRNLFLGASLPQYLRHQDAVTAPHFQDVWGRAVPLVWVSQRRYRLLHALSEKPHTKRQLLKRSRNAVRLFTSERSFDHHITQLTAAGWITPIAEKRGPNSITRYAVTDLGRKHLRSNAIPSWQSPVFRYTASPASVVQAC